MIDVRTATFRTIEAAFTPRRDLNVWQWAEQNVILPRRSTTRPGRYDSSWCPYVREPMECYTDPDVRTIVLCFASRNAKTEIFLNCLRYTVAEEPRACLWAKPNQDDAKNDSEVRFQPSVESSDLLRAEKPENRHQYRTAEMHFKRCSVFFVGAGSPARLKNKQIGRLFCDEIDTWPDATEKETGALEQALERVKDTPDPKILLSSTPTVASGQVWKEFIIGDQRFYFMPCWWCNRPIKFVLKGLRWADEARNKDGSWNLAIVKESVHYLCPLCKGKIIDKHKLPMLTAGRWQPTPTEERLKWEGRPVPIEEGRRSYHLNSLYPQWLHFYMFAEKFIMSKPDAGKWQSFINQWVAEPYFNFGNLDEMQEALKKTTIEVTSEAPPIPPGYRPLMHVDVQQLECWFRIRAFNAKRESLGLDFGMAASLADCEIIRKRNGVPFVGVDIGYHDRLQEVLEFVHHHRGQWVATHGSGTMFVPIRLANVNIGGGILKGVPVPCIKTNPIAWKEMLTDRIKCKPGVPAWKNEPTISELYTKQMAGEVRRERKGMRNTTIIEYIKIGANHAWDNEYNLLAMFDVFRPVMFGIADEPKNQKPPDPPPEKPAADDYQPPEKRDPDDVWAGERGLE